MAMPPIDEPGLAERWAMDDAEFLRHWRELAANLPSRPCDAVALERALGYPWERPESSFRLRDGQVDHLAPLSAAERDQAVAEFAGTGTRLPLLAIGSNGAPATLRRKFAHFAGENDRSALALVGRLRGFDVGFAAQPALYGSLPATLIASPGTSVRATLLWLTPAQFTQLAWSELSYRLGRLEAQFEVDEDGTRFDEVAVFVSRFGAFCPAGEPAALAAVPAEDRVAPALTQEEAMNAAAELVLGGGATAESLVRAVLEDLAGLAPRIEAAIHPRARSFEAEGWAPYGGRG